MIGPDFFQAEGTLPMVAQSPPLVLLAPGAFIYNNGNQTGTGDPADFSTVASGAASGYLPAVLTNINVGTIASGLSATGTTQAAAPAVTAMTSIYTTVATGTGVRLPAATSGVMTILNRGTCALSIYPPVSGQIESLGTNAALVIVSGTGKASLVPATSGQWYNW